MYERIVVALDGSRLAEQILPHVRPLAQQFDATLFLVCVVMPVVKPSRVVDPALARVPLDLEVIEPPAESEHEIAAKYLATTAISLKAGGLHKVQTEVMQGRPVDAIVAFAISLRADLIALTTRGRGGLSKLIFGSVAEGVLKEAPCPTLLVRAR